MIKSRVSRWIFTIVVFICMIMPKSLYIKWSIPVTYINIVEDVDKDSFGFIKLNDLKVVDKLAFKYSKNEISPNTEMIIKLSDDSSYVGYTKEEKMFSIPIVLYFRSSMYSNTEGFNKNIGSKTNTAIFKDFNSILLGILENKSWQDIGIDKNVAKGPIKLYIPSKNDFWYDVIVEEFYFVLNNYKKPTLEEKELLKDKVDIILNSCIEVEDISSSISELYSTNDKSKVFVGPENIILNFKNTDKMINTSISSYSPCYIKNTLGVYFDIYTKTNSNNEKVNLLKNELLNKCFLYTGVRSKYDAVSAYNTRCMDEINIIPYN